MPVDCDSTLVNIGREMIQVQSTIDKLKLRLVEAQQERANKLVYEELAKQALQHKSRHEMAKYA